jgi:hypothetical protein
MLCRRYGAELVVDDVVPARVAHGRVDVQPFERPIHLTVETARELGIDANDPVAGPGPRGKIAVSGRLFGQRPASEARVTLDQIVILSLAESDASRSSREVRPVDVREIAGAERLRWIVRISNELGVAALGDRADPYFAWTIAVADALPMLQLVRPGGIDTIEAVCGAVLSSSRSSGRPPCYSRSRFNEG